MLIYDTLFVLTPIVIGALLLNQYRRKWRLYSKLNRVDSYSIFDKTDSIPIQGTVRPHPDHQPFRKPFSDSKCVYEYWRIHHDRLTAISSMKDDTYKNQQSVPFVLTQGGQSIEVDVDQFGFTIFEMREVPDDGRLRADVPEQIDEPGLLQRSDETYRFLELGDEVTVFGTLEETDESSDVDYRITDPNNGDNRFYNMLRSVFTFRDKSIVTDYGRSALNKFKYKNMIKMGISSLFVATCVMIIVSVIVDVEFLYEQTAGMLILSIGSILIYAVASILHSLVNYILGFF